MELTNFIIQNKELVKIFYGLVIALICATIVIKTHRLYHLSLHQGIRYFRNAFLFFGIAFTARFLFGALFIYNYLDSSYSIITRVFFEFFLVMAGFFLLYSLIWKKIELSGTNYISSLLNTRIVVFYLMTAIIVTLDISWHTYAFLFFSQIIIFLFATAISFSNFLNNGAQHKFLKFYFVAMLLTFVAWSINAFAALVLNWHITAIINIYALNIIMFLLFLYGVIKLTHPMEYSQRAQDPEQSGSVGKSSSKIFTEGE